MAFFGFWTRANFGVGDGRSAAFFDFNYFNAAIPERDACAEGKSPLDILDIYTDGPKMDEGTGAGVFYHNLIIRCSSIYATVRRPFFPKPFLIAGKPSGK